jgi:hypothetical protein
LIEMLTDADLLRIYDHALQPGGGWREDEDHVLAALREVEAAVREECAALAEAQASTEQDEADRSFVERRHDRGVVYDRRAELLRRLAAAIRAGDGERQTAPTPTNEELLGVLRRWFDAAGAELRSRVGARTDDQHGEAQERYAEQAQALFVACWEAWGGEGRREEQE